LRSRRCDTDRWRYFAYCGALKTWEIPEARMHPRIDWGDPVR
jgi:hypothetical protein